MKINRQISNDTEGSFDKIDLAILRVLLLDSRKTLQEIGHEVGLSPTSCWTRIKKLEAQGVIKRYTIDVDPAKLGYHDSVIVQVTLESHTDETLYEFGRVLATIPEIQEAYLVSGDYDYYIRIAVRDSRLRAAPAREALQDSRHPPQQVALRAAGAEGNARAPALTEAGWLFIPPRCRRPSRCRPISATRQPGTSPVPRARS